MLFLPLESSEMMKALRHMGSSHFRRKGRVDRREVMWVRVSERGSAYGAAADFEPGGQEAQERPYGIESIWRSQQDTGPRTGAANPASGQCKGTTPAPFAQDGPSFSPENTMS